MHRIKYILLVLFFTINSHSAEYEQLWGISRDDFTKKIPASSDMLLFRPDEKPEYKNRIISFFNSMGGNSFDVKVLRINGTPEKDYCFFNDKLYSVSEDWGETSVNNFNSVLNKLQKEYSKPEIEDKESMTVYTFTKGKNKGLIYKRSIDSSRVKMRVFHYSNEIFNMLFKD